MRFYCCLACRVCYQVGGPLEEVHCSYWMALETHGAVQCPTSLCGGKLMRLTGPTSDPKFENKEIPLSTFFRAVNGFGSPDGQAATVKRFRELITTKKIVEVVASPVGQPERVILKQLVMEDGTRLHFDTSAKGACCYYIEEPGPSCLEVVDDAFRSESTDSNREEDGRAPEAGHSPGTATRNARTANAATSQRAEPGGMPSVSEARELSEPDRSDDGNLRPSSDVRV